MGFTKSLRWRLQAWHGVILVLVLFGLGIAAYRLYWNSQIAQLDEQLSRRLSALSSSIRGGGRPGDRMRPPPFGQPRSRREFPPPRGFPLETWELPPELESMFNQESDHPFVYGIWNRNGELVHGQSVIVRPPGRIGLQQQTIATFGNVRAAYVYTLPGECIAVSRSIVPQLEAARGFAVVLGSSGAAILLAGLAGGWWLATRAIKPIEIISSTAERISGGNLKERIPLEKTDNELDQLANVLNTTFNRLAETIEQQKQFTSDAAHELRTPLAVILTETQSVLAKQRSAEEYKDSLLVCQRAAFRMRNLTNALLTLARLDGRVEGSERLPVEMKDLISACIELVRPLAAEKGLTISQELQPFSVLGDEAKLELVITNLLSNAVQYNVQGGTISVKVTNGKIEITDSGLGISAMDLPRIFDRFYRGDKARTADGGTGLGLAICKAIVEDHKGSISVESETSRGTKFTVELPLA